MANASAVDGRELKDIHREAGKLANALKDVDRQNVSPEMATSIADAEKIYCYYQVDPGSASPGELREAKEQIARPA